jgi:hypothetical protein
MILMFLLLVAPEPLEERRGDIIARAEIDRGEVPLSGDVVLTLTVEGPAPLEVAPPRPLLTKASAQAWRVKEPMLPTREVLAGGRRQLWRQEFRLSPFEAGPSVAVALAPLRVKAGGAAETPITWEKLLPVTVTTTARPDPKSLRDVTGVEAVPAPPAAPTQDRRLLLAAAGGFGLALLLLIVARLLARRRRRGAAPPVHDAAWAVRELAALPGAPGDFARVAEVLRLYLRHRFDVPAGLLTSAELRDALRREDRLPAPLDEELRVILERCDQAKFAEGADSAGDAGAWIDLAWNLVERIDALVASNPSSGPSPKRRGEPEIGGSS